MNAINIGVTRPVNDWCSDGDRRRSSGASAPDGQPAGPAVAESWDDWGPFYTPMYSQLVGLNGSTVEMCSSTNTGTDPLNRCYLNADPTRPRTRSGGTRRCSAQLDGELVDAAVRHGDRNDLLKDQLEIYRRGVAGEARPPCCPAPFDRENNWMHEYPKAYVIPLGAGPAQRRRGEPARRLGAVQRHRGRQLRSTRLSSARRRRGLVRHLDGAAAPRARGDRAQHRRRHLAPIQQPVRAAGGVEPRLPLGRRHGEIPNGVPFTREDDEPITKPAVCSAAESRRARPTVTRSTSTRRPRCGR